MKKLTLLFTGLILGCQPSGPDPQVEYQCAPMGFSAEKLTELQSANFESAEITDLNAFTLALTDCLKDTRADVRDGAAYRGLTYLLRSQKLSVPTHQQLKTDLLDMTTWDTEPKVAAPFAALVLSELARTDRATPWMTDPERAAFVLSAANYVAGVKDYRGYDDADGWRHGVAHGSDWLMQLALNDKTSEESLGYILDGVASQIQADKTHAYIHGEPERLARPVILIAQRGIVTEAGWTNWLEVVTKPTPMENWNEAFQSESGLAQKHNTKAFINALYVNAAHSKDNNVRTMLPGLTTQIKKLP